MSRSKLRDRPGPPVRDVVIHMTPRQAEGFFEALYSVAALGEVRTLTEQRALDELRRRILVAAEIEP